MHIVPVYAALLALLFVFLSIRTIRLRRRLQIAIGHKDDALMLRAMRVHANFAEYAPFSLLLIAFVELASAPALFVQVLCLALLLGRCSHAWGVSQAKEDYRFRVGGMAMTFTAILLASIYLLYRHLLMPGA
jgi:uncharacterized membrane protein YecN with MAPEG domain